MRLAVALCALFALTLAAPLRASADVALLVYEPIGAAAEIHGLGHAAVYLSNVCSDDVVTVRLCRDGERSGVVLTTYPDFFPDRSPYWLAAPLNPFLYGVDDASDAPIFGTPEMLDLMRTRFAREHLAGLLGNGDAEDSFPPGEWSSLVANALLRNVYAFRLKTTREQDARVLPVLADVQRRRRYDLTYNNCADFARLILDTYFPKAVHRDLFNDFTFTTPKAIASTIDAYGRKHPELEFEVQRYRQLEGSIPRSQPNRHFTEKILTSKKYVAAAVYVGNPFGLAAFVGMYLVTGRFSMEKAFAESSPAPMMMPARVAASRTAAGTSINGAMRNIQQYRRAFDRLVSEAITKHVFPNGHAIGTFARQLTSLAPAEYGRDSRLRLRVDESEGALYVGLTRRSITDSTSNASLSYRLMMSVVSSELDAGGEHRPTAAELDDDWQLLNALHDRPGAIDPAAPLCGGACAPLPRKPWLLRLFTFITH